MILHNPLMGNTNHESIKNIVIEEYFNNKARCVKIMSASLKYEMKI